MIALPSSIEAVTGLITNRVQESIFLDYKRSEAISDKNRHEISRDISAFANSAGGTIIYGVREENHVPVKIDEGVDHRRYNREWLDQVIHSTISPRLSGVAIVAIPISDTQSIYTVQVAQTVRGPHQVNGEGRYYKRFNFRSVPMEDYEIQDVRTRSITAAPLVAVDARFEGGFVVYISVSNPGPFPAENVAFTFDPPLLWPDGYETPRFLVDGMKHFPPGREMRFLYGTYPEIIEEIGHRHQQLTVRASYTHPGTGKDVSETFHLNFLDFLNTSDAESDTLKAAKRLEDAIKPIAADMRRVVESLERISKLTDPTGLAISVRSLRNIRRLTEGKKDFELMLADFASIEQFKEVLGVDVALAYRLHTFFIGHGNADSIEKIEGMTPELIGALRNHFYSRIRTI